MIRSGMPTLLQGLLYGCLLAFSQILLDIFILLAVGSSDEARYLLLFLVSIMLLTTTCLALIFVGMKASERTGKVATGRNVAVWTSFFSSIIYSVCIFAFGSSQVDDIRARSQNIVDVVGLSFQYTNAFIFVILLSMCIGLILITVGAGFGFGTIGGILGQKRVQTSGQSPLHS